MFQTEFSIREDFPPISYEEWRSLVEADLKGVPFDHKLVTRLYEGIEIQPLYSLIDQPARRDAAGFPGLPPYARGRVLLGSVEQGWDLRQEHHHPDRTLANKAILEDLQGGVTSLLLSMDSVAKAGWDADDERANESAGQHGLMLFHIDHFEELLADVELEGVTIALDAGAAFLPAAAFVAGLWERRDVPPALARGAFNADPIAVLAREGELPYSSAFAIKQLTELAAWTSRNYPQATAVSVETLPYHHAGASATQDIAFALATGVYYLRAMTETLSVDEAARQFVFRMSVGTHHFLSIAKLRAARRLWSRVIEASGGSGSSGGMRLHVQTSRRVLTQRDPFVNLLRNAVGVFAAGIGGADSITSVPFDSLSRIPDAFSRRIARNTLLVIQEEAQLHRVIDPAGGSWFLEKLTEQVAEQAWGIFQDIERQGGMLAALQSGWVAEQIEAAYAPRAKDIARRKEGITGVSEFPDVHEDRLEPAAIDGEAIRNQTKSHLATARKEIRSLERLEHSSDRIEQTVKAACEGASLGQLAEALGFHRETAHITTLKQRSFAEPYELLRNAADDWQAVHGKRPAIFLANMGPVAHHSARANYAKNFFEAGGFEVLTNDGFPNVEAAVNAWKESQAQIAVICSSDKLYPDLVPELAPRLKQAGVRTIVLAGHPGSNEAAWQAAGVDRFIFMKCDVLATLQDLLREEGVLST